MRRVLKFTLLCSLLMTLGCMPKTDKLVLNNNGVEKIKFFTFVEGGNILLTDEKGKSFKINEKNQVELKFEVLSKIKKRNDFYIVKKDGKIGVLDKNYKEVVKIIYDNIENLGDTEFLKVQRDGKNYLLKFDNYTLSQEYDEIQDMKDGSIIKLRQGKSTWYLDKNGNEIKSLTGKNILFWREDVAVTVEDNKYGLIDLKNQKLVENLYEEIYFSDENILVKEEGKYYLNGKYLENITRVYPTMTDVLIYDVGNDKFGLFNLRDLKSSKETYDEVMFRYNDYIIVGKDEKYGVINKYSDEAPEFKYRYVLPAGVDSFAGGTDEGTGLVALIVGDKQVTDEKYDAIYSLVEGYYIGELAEKLFLINKNGEEILGIERDNILYYSNEALVLKDGEKLIIHKLKRS